MSATQELIAAALTACDVAATDYEGAYRAKRELREACARAMVQPAAPDMAEVEQLVEQYARAYVGNRDLQRTALLDYVRNIIAERDALIADNERLSGLYEQAVKGRADMRSALRDARAAAPHPVGAAEDEALTSALRASVKVVAKGVPVSAADAPMPESDYRLLTPDSTETVWNRGHMRQYGDAREAAGCAAGVAASIAVIEKLIADHKAATKECDDNGCDIVAAWETAVRYLRGEVK